jgi:hypothetical protein
VPFDPFAGGLAMQPQGAPAGILHRAVLPQKREPLVSGTLC